MSASITQSALLDALSRASRALEVGRIDHVFIGGIAVVAWSQPRSTVDIDLLVAAEAADPQAVLVALGKEGFHLEGKIHKDVLMYGFKARRDYPGQRPVRVDVLVSRNPAAIDIVGRGVTRDVTGIKIRTPALEDLIVLKLQAGRYQDLADCEALLAANRGSLNLELLRSQAEAFGVSDALAQLLPRRSDEQKTK